MNPPLLIPGSVSAQTFKETYISFQKFEAKTRAGVTLDRYTEGLADLEYSTKTYAKEADKLNADNVRKFEYALEKYKLARRAWSLYQQGQISDYPEGFVTFSPNYCPSVKYFATKYFDNFNECISSIWQEASEAISSVKEVKRKVGKK